MTINLGTSPSAHRPYRRRRLRTRWVLALLLAAPMMGSGTAAATKAHRPPRVGREMPVTATHQSVGPANNSPTLDADPNEPRFVAMANRLDAPDFGCALHLSGDGGRHWAPAVPVLRLPEGVEKCYAPEVAFDRHGILYYLFVGLAGLGNEPVGAFLTSSADRGRTFGPARRVLGPLSFAVRMAIDPGLGRSGRIHLVWIKATSDPPLGGFGPPPNPIMSSWSDNGGSTFSEPVQVSRGPARVVAPALALGGDHAVHVAYYDLRQDAVDYQGLEGEVWDGRWSLVLTSSTNGGETFGPGVVVNDRIAPPERVMLIFTMAAPALAVRDRRLCVAWPDARWGDPDVLTSCSADRGQRWTKPVKVNDDKSGAGVSQLLPRLSFAPGGRLDAVFYDRRLASGNMVNDTFFSYSADGGKTWTPNVRVTRHGSDSRVGQQYGNVSAAGMVEFGSRLGLISRDHGAVAAWADTRNSRPETTTQDIFTALVVLPGGGGDAPATFVAAVLTGAAAVAAGAAGWRIRRRSRLHRDSPPTGEFEGR